MKNIILNLLLAASIVSSVMLSGCKKEDDNNNPNDEMTGSSPIAAFTASETEIDEGKSISFTDQSTNTPTTWSWDFGDGGISTQQNPSHTYDTAGTYTVSLTATNSYGSNTETKSNYISVNTVASTFSFTDSRDGKVYKYVTIGNQVWMAENLAYTGSGQHITDNNQWKNNTAYNGWCYYKNKTNNGNTYGVLYQWEAAKAACPAGWHLPTDAEWKELTDYLGGENVAGGKMKEIGTTHWDSPNTGADNSSGFSALPGGYRNTYGSFYYLGDDGYWWSATKGISNTAYIRILHAPNATVNRYYDYKAFGFSVRCIKN